jgi:hypothetical protein
MWRASSGGRRRSQGRELEGKAARSAVACWGSRVPSRTVLAWTSSDATTFVALEASPASESFRLPVTVLRLDSQPSFSCVLRLAALKLAAPLAPAAPEDVKPATSINSFTSDTT